MFKPSTAQDYDRSADRSTDGRITGDEDREVILDPDSEDTPEGDRFWLEQRPPHYGAE
ncbi:hypothetical protein [Corynebacterium pacaense]|uniref:hypothetical protein n=1 Tax=Corynebacterium pacaense TaxID=1816684 RepID=UPI001FE9ABB5|nr:hypothetical protein [Corynebacterium pacaense]